MATQPPRTDLLYDEEPGGGEWIVIRERLHRTADGRAVAEDDKDGRWLYAIPGTRISRAEAIAVGIVRDDPQPVKRPNRAKKPGGTK